MSQMKLEVRFAMKESLMDEQAKHLAGALGTILEAIEKVETGRGGRSILPPKVMTLGELADHCRRGDPFVWDPLGQSLRLGVKHIGEVLVRNGYDQAVMIEVAEHVAGSNGTRADIIDKWWDGIKLADGSTWAA
jgi:hypothetical protein